MRASVSSSSMAKLTLHRLSLRCAQHAALLPHQTKTTCLPLAQERCPTLLEDPQGVVIYVLTCCRYLEHVRGARLVEAVAFAREALAPFRGTSAERDADLVDLAGLLAYPDPLASPLAHLMSQKQKVLLFSCPRRT